MLERDGVVADSDISSGMPDFNKLGWNGGRGEGFFWIRGWGGGGGRRGEGRGGIGSGGFAARVAYGSWV